MPKKPIFESAVHHILLQARRVADAERLLHPTRNGDWHTFIDSMEFSYVDTGTIDISWTHPRPGTHRFSLKGITYYYRGDTPDSVERQKTTKQQFAPDEVRRKNDEAYFLLIKSIARKAGMSLHRDNTVDAVFTLQSLKRFSDEEHLSDDWARDLDVSTIDVRKVNEAPTAPEMRHIMRTLGDIRGKRILDIGCGLGEASVYFATKGALVTATDISRNMLDTTKRLARQNNVTVTTYQSSIEHLRLPKNTAFDIIYVGNLFHHVDIPRALQQVVTYLEPRGMLVAWEPVHYNPVINVYRKIATKVRSHDERPLKLSDIDLFRSYFKSVTTHWYWLTTLMLFVLMAVSGKDPNKDRYWKAVLREADFWKPLYTPLARLDQWLLKTFPVLGLLCWNVVIIARGPKKHKAQN